MRSRFLAGLLLAGGLAVAPVAAAGPAGASVPAPAHRCVVHWTNSIRTNQGGYYRATVTSSCSGVGVQAEALCKVTPTIGTSRRSSTLYGKGTVTAQCHSNEQVAEASLFVGGVRHHIYP